MLPHYRELNRSPAHMGVTYSDTGVQHLDFSNWSTAAKQPLHVPLGETCRERPSKQHTHTPEVVVHLWDEAGLWASKDFGIKRPQKWWKPVHSGAAAAAGQGSISVCGPKTRKTGGQRGTASWSAFWKTPASVEEKQERRMAILKRGAVQIPLGQISVTAVGPHVKKMQNHRFFKLNVSFLTSLSEMYHCWLDRSRLMSARFPKKVTERPRVCRTSANLRDKDRWRICQKHGNLCCSWICTETKIEEEVEISLVFTFFQYIVIWLYLNWSYMVHYLTNIQVEIIKKKKTDGW